MRILLYGYRGWIGGMLKDYLESNGHTVIEGKTRLEEPKKLRFEIVVSNVDCIICAIGRTHGVIGEKIYPNIDYLEEEGKLIENIRDNLYGPFNLMNISEKLNIHLTYFGTGCIFQGHDEFEETDNPNFFGSSYSIVKGFTDRMTKLYSNVLNLRIRMPIIGKHHHRNFITKIVGYKDIASIPNSMTVIDDMLPVINDMITKKITGTFNLTNPGTINHDEILKMYKAYVDPSHKWNLVNQQDLKVGKRSNNSLSTKKLQDLYPEIPNIKVSIEKLLKNWNK